MIKLLDDGYIEVTATDHEVALAQLVASGQSITSISTRQISEHPDAEIDREPLMHSDDTLRKTITGVLGELVFSRFIERPWVPTLWRPANGTPDVRPDWQVRTNNWATHPDWAREQFNLLLREHDKGIGRWVSLLRNGNRFIVCGWIAGKEAKEHPVSPIKPNSRYGHCHKVPLSALSRDFGYVTARLRPLRSKEMV